MKSKTVSSNLPAILKESQDKLNQIKAYHAVALIGSEEQPAIKQQIAQAREASLADAQKITERSDSMEKKLAELSAFHTKIYGVPAVPADPDDPDTEASDAQHGDKHPVFEAVSSLNPLKKTK